MTAGLVLGLITGLTYGLLAVGIVLIFRANRFINIAHAQLGTLSALLLGRLVLDSGWSYWIAFPLVIAVAVAVALVVERFVVRPMLSRRRHAVSLLLVSIGVAQLLLALAYVPNLGPSADALYREGYPVPLDVEVEAGSFVLRGQHVLIIVLVPAIVLLLAGFLRYTILGKTIRAAASNPDAARLCGISVTRVSAVAWGIAGALSAVTAVLQAPSQGSFSAAALGPALLLRALGAAALGGFTSIPAALVGGVLIGEAEHITLALGDRVGTAELVVFLLVVAILFARGSQLSAAVAARSASDEEPAPPRVPASVVTRPVVRLLPPALGLLVLAVAVLAPLMPFLDTEANRFKLVVVAVMAIAGVSLTMLVGWAGQVSLGHFAILGLGAYLAAKLGAHDLSLPLVLVVAALVGGAVTAAIGLPALRLRGLTLAVTTLGFAVVAPVWLFQQPWLGAEGQSAVVVPATGFVGVGRAESQLSIYYVALALLVVVLVAARGIRRSMPGRVVLAVRDNERAASSFGLTPATSKIMILAVSGAFVAMAGVLWGTAWRTVSIDLVSPDASLVLLAIPVIGGLGSLSGAVAGALVVYLPSLFLAPLVAPLFGDFGKQIGFQLAVAGLGLVMVPLMYPAGLAGIGQRWWQRFVDSVAKDVEREEPAEDHEVPLVVTGVTKRFGGVSALNGIDIEVHPGEIVGLIGPNGAGKTTLMNVVSGDLSCDSGAVRVYGRDVTSLPSYVRAQLGLGRGYQDASLFAGLTSREVIQVAMASGRRVGTVSALLAAPWVRRSERATRRAADEILERFGLDAWADTRAAELSTGSRRICAVAAQVAAAPKVLLLDEPTAGVAQREAEQFGPLLRSIRDELDCSILLIEHDMPLLMGLCDRVYALAEGEVIAVGTPEEIRNDRRVVASYLGESEVAVARSGSRPVAGA